MGVGWGGPGGGGGGGDNGAFLCKVIIFFLEYCCFSYIEHSFIYIYICLILCKYLTLLNMSVIHFS